MNVQRPIKWHLEAWWPEALEPNTNVAKRTFLKHQPILSADLLSKQN